MDQQRIKQLIDLLAESDLGEMTLSEGGTTVTLSRQATTPAPVVETAMPGPAQACPADVSPARIASQVCSPLYGVLHLTPSPDQPPFVRVGASVAVGQILCIVEAMKMFHQVKASQAGYVEAILARAGDEVEAGQPLFAIV